MPVRRNNADDLGDKLRRLNERVDKLQEIVSRRALPQPYVFAVVGGQLVIKNRDTGAVSSPIV